jgi:hypothetical protein
MLFIRRLHCMPKQVVMKKENNKIIQIEVVKYASENKKYYSAIYEEPWFFVRIEKDPEWYDFYKGDQLVFYYNGKKETRSIYGVNTEYSFLANSFMILAPKNVAEERNYDYVEDSSPNGNIKLRPGAIVMGGHSSSFYDAYGLIVEAEFTGGDAKIFHDWAYRVIADGYLSNLSPVWITLDDIAFAIKPAGEIQEVNILPSTSLDELLNNGRKELFEYYALNKSRISNITPKQLEDLVLHIYKNNGFTVQRIGNWNQADGGIDIIAIEKNINNGCNRLAIQCKCSKNKISVGPVRELAGVLTQKKNDSYNGVIVTTSIFTRYAKEECEGSYLNISLQDRDDLYKKIVSIVLSKE